MRIDDWSSGTCLHKGYRRMYRPEVDSLPLPSLSINWIVWYIPWRCVAEDVQCPKVDSPSPFSSLSLSYGSVCVCVCVCWWLHYLICGSERVLVIVSLDLQS